MVFSFSHCSGDLWFPFSSFEVHFKRITVGKQICMLEMEVDLDLQKARIHALPQEGFYISDFIKEDEEEFLLQKVNFIVHSFFFFFSIDFNHADAQVL